MTELLAMKCPNCNENAIQFKDWIRARNAFSTRCGNCNIHLKANASVYVSFIITIIATVLLLLYVENALNWFNLNVEISKVKIVLLLPAILLGALLGWFSGGYRVKNSNWQFTAPDATGIKLLR
ncbi:hypothetical protein [Microbulbifer sediminum]|uniref:hypothetical protein n=1 Tax=Microbulbifer sediminum TaxID=2904250 RepID=UPI001F3F0E5A|nr:hypothetical protein [Microbulbifer sediminum]